MISGAILRSASSFANCFENCRVIELIAAARCVVILQQMDADDEFDDVALDAVALVAIAGGYRGGSRGC